VLQLLESEQLTSGLAGTATRRVPPRSADQLGLFAGPVHPVVERLKALDVNTLTPLAALALLAELTAETRRSG
jgi:hypothetical protein